MKFLIDAQLPRKLADWLIAAGLDAKHTLDLPNGNKTSDQQILAVSKDEDRIVVTKDSDFVDEFLLHGRPDKILVISTGNISNKALGLLFVPSIPDIVNAFTQYSFLELGRDGIQIRV